MGKLKTTEEVVRELKLVHLNMFNYDKVEYKGDKYKIEVICNSCGKTFYPRVTNHKQGSGCPHCYKKKQLTEEEFISKVKIVHKDKYNYTDMQFKSLHNKIIITCPIHGDFEQIAANHLKGHGCKYCNLGGGVEKFTAKSASKGVDNDCICYVIKCFNDNETFFKIGITTKTINLRFKSKKDLPYHYTILKEYVGTSVYIYNLEKHLHEVNSKHKYIPLKTFSGATECFKILESYGV